MTETENLKNKLLECRSSVKTDLISYERVLLAAEKSGDKSPIVEAEVERLRDLLDFIDKL